MVASKHMFLILFLYGELIVVHYYFRHIKEIVNTFDIKDKVISLVTDSSSITSMLYKILLFQVLRNILSKMVILESMMEHIMMNMIML